MRLSLDDGRLITASRDGSLCFWKVPLSLLPLLCKTLFLTQVTETFKAGSKTSSAAPEGVVEYANEILITKSELEEKNKLVHNLQQQVDETKTESEYQLRYLVNLERFVKLLR